MWVIKRQIPIRLADEKLCQCMGPDELINDYCQAPTGNIRDFQHCNKRWFTFFCRLQIDSVTAFTTNDHLDGTEDTVKLVVCVFGWGGWI